MTVNWRYPSLLIMSSLFHCEKQTDCELISAHTGVHRPICVYNPVLSHRRTSAADLNIQATSDANAESRPWLTKERREKPGMQDISAAFYLLNKCCYWFHERENKDTGALVIWKKPPKQFKQANKCWPTRPLPWINCCPFTLFSPLLFFWNLALLETHRIMCPRPPQFSNVRLNMHARLVSSQALAAIYGRRRGTICTELAATDVTAAFLILWGMHQIFLYTGTKQSEG